MAYIDNRTVLVDAVLTPAGKSLLSEGRLNITKFALFDDEIDYSLFDGNSLYGQNDVDILKLPLIEPKPNYVPMFFISDREPRTTQFVESE